MMNLQIRLVLRSRRNWIIATFIKSVSDMNIYAVAATAVVLGRFLYKRNLSLRIQFPKFKYNPIYTRFKVLQIMTKETCINITFISLGRTSYI